MWIFQKAILLGLLVALIYALVSGLVDNPWDTLKAVAIIAAFIVAPLIVIGIAAIAWQGVPWLRPVITWVGGALLLLAIAGSVLTSCRENRECSEWNRFGCVR